MLGFGFTLMCPLPTPLILIVARMKPTDMNKGWQGNDHSTAWFEWLVTCRCEFELFFGLAGVLPCCRSFNAFLSRRALSFDCELFGVADVTLVFERPGNGLRRLRRSRHVLCLVFVLAWVAVCLAELARE